LYIDVIASEVYCILHVKTGNKTPELLMKQPTILMFTNADKRI